MLASAASNFPKDHAQSQFEHVWERARSAVENVKLAGLDQDVPGRRNAAKGARQGALKVDERGRVQQTENASSSAKSQPDFTESANLHHTQILNILRVGHSPDKGLEKPASTSALTNVRGTDPGNSM